MSVVLISQQLLLRIHEKGFVQSVSVRILV